MKFFQITLKKPSGELIHLYDPRGYNPDDKNMEELKNLIQEEYKNKEKTTGYILISIDSNDDNSRVFETGAMRGTSEGKENYIRAISWTALKRVTEYQNNAEKKGGYDKGFWKLGIPEEESEKSLMRHLQKYFSNKYEGTAIEPEVDHLAAAYFNLQGIIHEQEKNK